MGIRKMNRNMRNTMGKLLLLLALTMSCTACSAKKDEVPSAEDKVSTEVMASESDRKLNTTPTDEDSDADEDNNAMLNEDNKNEDNKNEDSKNEESKNEESKNEESKKEADNSEDTMKEEELAKESEDSDATQSDSDRRYETFQIVNPDEAEYFGESPSFTISYDDENIQISLDFVGSNTFSMYEPDDTSFSAQPEVVSFSMGDDGMGVPSDQNSTLELKVNGDEATVIFHYPEGGQSDPVSFERIN